MSQIHRERVHQETLAEIQAAAWKQIAAEGVSSLSLRAIAREMGMTAPGLYRYFPSRDELVTSLVISAFTSFAGYLEAARDRLPVEDYPGRFRAVGEAYFHWALAYPAHYTLIFGSPVPGYHMGEAAFPAARRAFLVIQSAVGEALAAGKIHPQERLPNLPPGLLARYEALRALGMPYDPLATHLALTTWAGLHGAVSLSLYGYLESFLGDQVEPFISSQVERLAHSFGMVLE